MSSTSKAAPDKAVHRSGREAPWRRRLALFVLSAALGAHGTVLAATPEPLIRRLPPSAFPELPPSIRQTLEQRACLVPQLWEGWRTQPHNVVRGAFFKKHRADWAVLCSVDGKSAILVFPQGSSQPAAELAPAADEQFLQTVEPGKYGFSRAIGAMGRQRILEYGREWRSKLPVPLNHQGINDAFVEKASVIHYFHKGKWLELPGAD